MRGQAKYSYKTIEEVIAAGDQAVRDNYFRIVTDVAADALRRFLGEPEKQESYFDGVVSLFCTHGTDSFLRMVLRSSNHLEGWIAHPSPDTENWLRSVCREAMLADVRAELERLCGPP